MSKRFLTDFPIAPVPRVDSLDFCQNFVPAQSSFKQIPRCRIQILTFSSIPTSISLRSTATNSISRPCFLSKLCHWLVSASSLPSSRYRHDDHDEPSTKNPAWISFSLKPTPAHLFDTQYLVLCKEVTSTVCTSVAILTTVIRLLVRRLVFWFDDVSRFPWRPTHLENLLVDWPMNI